MIKQIFEGFLKIKKHEMMGEAWSMDGNDEKFLKKSVKNQKGSDNLKDLGIDNITVVLFCTLSIFFQIPV